MLKTLTKLWQDEEAPTAVEYAVMLALIVLVIIAAVTTLGTNTRTTFQNVATQVPGGGGANP